MRNLNPNTTGPVGTTNPVTKRLFKIGSNSYETQLYQNQFEQNNILVMQGMRKLHLYCSNTFKTTF